MRRYLWIKQRGKNELYEILALVEIAVMNPYKGWMRGKQGCGGSYEYDR